MPCTIHLPFHFFIILSSVLLLSLPFFLSSVCSVAVKAMELTRVATISLSLLFLLLPRLLLLLLLLLQISDGDGLCVILL
jgi:hypothetical protein